MRISYAHECVTITSKHSDMVGQSSFIKGMFVVITKAQCFGMREQCPGKKYSHKVLEVETNHNNWSEQAD